MTVPTISNLPTVPATSDPNFETEAPALFNHIKNTFVSEMNSAISFINSSTFDATVEFKNANFTAARNFLYMIDTSSAAVSVTLPANPSTGDQLLLMDQKRTFGTNNLTIGRNSQNINGAASDVVSKSTGALIRCIFQASYGWTVDLYEGEWESGTSAGDLVYNGGNVGIGTSSPASPLQVVGELNAGINANRVRINSSSSVGIVEFNSTEGVVRSNSGSLEFQTNGSNDRMIIDSSGNVGIGTSAPGSILEMKSTSNTICTIKASSSHVSAIDFADADASQRGYIRYNHSDDSMQLWSAGSNRLTIGSAGDVEISTGNLVIGTAGKGIDFSANSHATGMTSELLDSYEEGSWSPVVADASSGGNTASGSFSGTYTKIGRVVTVHCYALNINTTGMTSTNSLVIRNLPFQNVGLIAKYGSVRLDSVTFSGYCTAQIGGSASHVSIIENKNGLGNSGLTVADLTSGVSDIYFGLTYETS